MSCGLFCDTYLLCSLFYKIFVLILIEFDEVTSANAKKKKKKKNEIKIKNQDKIVLPSYFLILSLTVSSNHNLSLCFFTLKKKKIITIKNLISFFFGESNK